MSEIIESIGRMRSPKKLLQIIEAVKVRLNELEFSTSLSDPVGHYGECLVQRFFDAEKTNNGTAGCDLITPKGLKIEVKTRIARSEDYVPKTYIKDSNVSNRSFDYLVYIVLDSDFDVCRAYGITYEQFTESGIAEQVTHQNVTKWVFRAKPEHFENFGVKDLTESLAAINLT